VSGLRSEAGGITPAIISVLIAPRLPTVRESARRPRCMNNRKQLGIALHNDETAYGVFPLGRIWESGPDGCGNGTGFFGVASERRLTRPAAGRGTAGRPS
jgi:Protein of unknown function (DUF1559)